MDLTKETMGVGIASMSGQAVLGTMASLPNMPAGATNVANIAGAGLQLANIGQLAKVGIGLTNVISDQTGTTKKKTSSLEVNKILGL